MENKEKIAFVQKELEQVEYDLRTYGSLAKSSEESLKTWNAKIEEGKKKKLILEEALDNYKIIAG